MVFSLAHSEDHDALCESGYLIHFLYTLHSVEEAFAVSVHAGDQLVTE